MQSEFKVSNMDSRSVAYTINFNDAPIEKLCFPSVKNLLKYELCCF